MTALRIFEYSAIASLSASLATWFWRAWTCETCRRHRCNCLIVWVEFEDEE